MQDGISLLMNLFQADEPFNFCSFRNVESESGTV